MLLPLTAWHAKSRLASDVRGENYWLWHPVGGPLQTNDQLIELHRVVEDEYPSRRLSPLCTILTMDVQRFDLALTPSTLGRTLQSVALAS